MINNTLSIEEVANKLKVLPSDIQQWIKEGKIKAIQQNDNGHRITVEEYQKFGRSFPDELRAKIGEYMWKYQLEILPPIQKEVSERFINNIQPVLDRAEVSVKILEDIHKKYEPYVNVFDEEKGSVAAFILYARAISLLYSIIYLLRGGVPAESLILFRPLWEAILLADYFLISEVNKENERQIRRWFKNEETPPAKEVRYYLSQKANMPLEVLKELNHSYSKPIHHTYKVIMEFYRQVSMSGFLGEHNKRFGFDYHKSSVMRDVVLLVTSFEQLLLSALQVFFSCFYSLFTDEEIMSINSEIDFYSMDSSKRLKKIFGNE